MTYFVAGNSSLSRNALKQLAKVFSDAIVIRKAAVEKELNRQTSVFPAGQYFFANEICNPPLEKTLFLGMTPEQNSDPLFFLVE